MNTTQKKWTLILLALIAVAASVVAAEPTLKIGSPAPKLQNGDWIQGDPIKGFQLGQAYLIDFWATWSGSSRSSISRVNELHNKFKDRGLVVIGQDCLERNEAQVAPFVKQMGDKMAYRIAFDDKTGSKQGKMVDIWMSAAGRRGLPSAFLIDTKGVVVWIGNPAKLKDEVVEQVLAGKYDIQKSAAEYEQGLQKQAEREKEMAPAAVKINAANAAMNAKDWDEAMDDLTAAEQLLPEKRRAGMAAGIGRIRFTILLGKKDYPAAYELAAKLSAAHKDDANLQNIMAWQIVGDKTVEKPNLELAETLVNRANAAAKGKDPDILDTQARVLFMKGQKEEAVKAEAQAVALTAPERRQAKQSTLDSYKKGELPSAN